ncbi:hypothetical protein [Rathayibacter sp. AY1C6]|uniref:hypothetical protein n=1 Tax=Rathayibacter sp. AY1C6 TaxID=2080539 RepID=UPI0011B08730|nr:hypothetical protein [Rathayibacter sp. AY1C6]
MNEQMAQRRYAAALARIRDGLECAPDALVYFKERHPSVGLPPSIPVIDSKAGAVVALFGAIDAIEKMAELVEWIQLLEPGWKVPDVARYKADARLVATLRNILEKSPICD